MTQSVHNNPSATTTLVEETYIQHPAGKVIIALGIIIMVGSLIANGCLYAHLGAYAFVIGVVGLALGIAFITCGKCCCIASTIRRETVQAHPELTTAQNNNNSQHSVSTTSTPNASYSLERFLNDTNYRVLQLMTGSCFTNESEANQELLKHIVKHELVLIPYRRLPKHVQQDMCQVRGGDLLELGIISSKDLPFSPEQFGKDKLYRYRALRDNLWFTTDSVTNQKLIRDLSKDELAVIPFQELPKIVQQDICEVRSADLDELGITYPKKAPLIESGNQTACVGNDSSKKSEVSSALLNTQSTPPPKNNSAPPPPIIAGPFDPERFIKDTTYCKHHLDNMSWYSDDSSKNKTLIQSIPYQMLLLLKCPELPQNVQKDIYDSVKSSPQRLKHAFYYPSNAIYLLEPKEIISLYGEYINIRSLGIHYEKLSPEMKTRYLKAIYENYYNIPGIATPENLTSFICTQLLVPLDGLDEATQLAEFEKLYELIMSFALYGRFFLTNFAKFYCGINYPNNKIVLEKFPHFLTQKLLELPEEHLRPTFIMDLFCEENCGICARLSHVFNKKQKLGLKEIFTRFQILRPYVRVYLRWLDKPADL